MKLALDTNAYCLCDLGRDHALTQLAHAVEIYLPVIVYGELYYGFRHGTRFSANLKRLDAFIAQFAVKVIPVGQDVAKCYGDIFLALRKKGHPIPTNDVWIAASAMSVGATLLTSDPHFAVVDQIRVEWLADE